MTQISNSKFLSADEYGIRGHGGVNCHCSERSWVEVRHATDKCGFGPFFLFPEFVATVLRNEIGA